MSKPVYLGKLTLFWCSSCKVPVLDGKCACGQKTEKMTITPPGDIRPAFPYDVNRINEVSRKQFGADMIRPDEIVLYNKAPYEDRMEEIICGGVILGTIRFETEKTEWVLMPRIEGARRICNTKTFTPEKMKSGELKNLIVLNDDAVPYVAEGTSVLVPGIYDVSDNISAEDEVIIITKKGEVVAAGRAKMSSEEMRNEPRGKAAKLRWKGTPADETSPEYRDDAESGFFSAPRTWDDVIAANRNILDTFERRSIDFIRNTAGNMDKRVTCSYSGGKDSLVTLCLTNKALDDFDILFSDTGLEFDETLENVRKVAEIYGKPFRTTSAGNAFWEGWEINGPPSVDNRWCNKMCKLTPITALIEDNYAENGCLTFIGQRKYESLARAKSERVWRSQAVPNQIGAAPIQDWTALHVWLYIFREKLPYNPLYEKGFDRIGCWLCPAASLADFMNLRITHPAYMAGLDEKLRPYAEDKGNPEEWIRYGFWRFGKLPPFMQHIAEAKGIITGSPAADAPAEKTGE